MTAIPSRLLLLFFVLLPGSAAAAQVSPPAGRNEVALDVGILAAGLSYARRIVGYRFLFIGPEAALGRVSDERHGADFGALWGVQVRLVFGW